MKLILFLENTIHLLENKYKNGIIKLTINSKL